MSNENYVQTDVLIQIESIKLSDLNPIEVDQQRINNDESKKSNMKIKEICSSTVNNNCSLNAKEEPKSNDKYKYQTVDESNQISGKGKFYEDAKKYWSNIPATVDGMLGGFGNISVTDLKGSRAFLNCLHKMKSPPGKRYALDCGAGIGRVTKGLLLSIFDRVDVVEQDLNFTQKLQEYIDSKDNSERIGQVYNVGLQEFVPESSKYDIVWCQWVLGHLTDDDLLKFFQRVKLSFCKNGLLVIKENVSSSNCIEVDHIDSSMTRSLKMYQDLIKKSNYRIIKLTKQTNFPKSLYPVYIFACKPK